MSVFPEWHLFAIPQRRLTTGCIPTGYEMILRAAHAQGIDFGTFQDEFDLDKDRGQPPFYNNFESVAQAVQARYPAVCFRVIHFDQPGKGADKLWFVEQHVQQKKPLLISLAQVPFGGNGYHIMPVVDMDEQNLILLKIVWPDGRRELQPLAKSELIRIHGNYQGGEDVAYLERC